MGDNKAPPTTHSSLPGHLLQGASTGSRMDALMSAIEYDRMKMGLDPALGPMDPKLLESRAMLYGNYLQSQGLLGTHHPENRRSEQEGQSAVTTQPSALYPSHVPFPASGVVPGAAATYLGLNPMLMPFMPTMLPDMRVNSTGGPAHGSGQTATEERTRDTGQGFKCPICGTLFADTVQFQAHMQKHMGVPLPHMLPHMGHRSHERESGMRDGHSSAAGRRPETSGHGPAESLPNPYSSGLQMFQPGMGLTPDKLQSVHDPSTTNMRYPMPGALNPYLGYQNLLAANPGALLPQMLPSSWNQALGALGYPYYPGGLLSRPYLPHMPPASIPVPSASNPSTPPIQSIPTEVTPPAKASTPTRLDPSRPLSGGYLPTKETLQKRLSAPVMVSGSPGRVPGRGELLGKGNSNYPGYPHRTHLPSQLIAPTPDSSKSVKSNFMKGRIDHKSIEQHISKLISHNEKILTNPTLDRVKPRRVFRRTSLDPSTMSPNPTHNPLTATYSAPRALEPDYQKAMLDDRPTETQNFLTVPSRLTEPHIPTTEGGHGEKPFVTVIPDPRRDPSLRFLTDAKLRERLVRKASDGSSSGSLGYDQLSERARAAAQDVYHHQQGSAAQPPHRVSAGGSHGDVGFSSFRCGDCGVQFSKPENYEAHKKSYCLKRPPGGSIFRESVIQHTGVQPDPQDLTLPIPAVPQVSVTPPPESMGPTHPLSADPKPFLSIQQANLLANPMKRIHKELQRTRSADAAFHPSHLGGDRAPTGSHSNVPVSKASSKPPSPIEGTEQDTKSNTGLLSVSSNSGRSSIPTDKLPPKKKQLQLMRSNSSSQSYTEATKSPSRHTPVSMSPEHSPNSHGSKTPEPSPAVVTEPPHPAPESRASPLIMITPPAPTPVSGTGLPAWIPLDRDDSPNKSPKRGMSPVLLPPAPTVYLTQDGALTTTTGGVALPRTAPITTSARSPPSPRSPRSPTRRSSPGRSPSRSPTRSPNLESTIPRSNYKLLLHQLSVRNMQDMDYLSEAYHNSKDKNLKRNIASLLQSSSVAPSSYLGSQYAKRGRAFSPERAGVKMEELYPGKASLARRLSPNADRLGGKYDGSSLSPKPPLAQSRSKPYEDSLSPYPSVSVTRSHSAGYSSDVNNNIKQYLQNKSRNQAAAAAAVESGSQPSKTHKPLRRQNANARYVLKSPTKDIPTSQSEATTSNQSVPAGPSEGWKASVGKTLSASRECTERLKESLALKRASSYNPESSYDYQSKRRKLIPIPQKTKLTSASSALPPSLVAPRISEKEKRPEQKPDTSDAVRVSSLLYPHLAPKMSFEPHATFCSLLSPQPMYVELESSTPSMYSQWAVTEPMMLPDGLTVMDLFKNTRILKGLSPYISYSSLFMSSSKEGNLSLTDTKKYEASAKEAKEKAESKPKVAASSKDEEPGKDVKEQSKDEEESKKVGESKTNDDWIWSKMEKSRLQSSKVCYTSCHSKNMYKPKEKKPAESPSAAASNQAAQDTEKAEVRKVPPPKIQPPKVVIHPPSPAGSDESNDDSRNDEIAALEFSDSSDDTLPDRLSPTNHFLLNEKGASPFPQATPPSDQPAHPFPSSTQENTSESRENLPKSTENSSTGTTAPSGGSITGTPPKNGPATLVARDDDVKKPQNCADVKIPVSQTRHEPKPNDHMQPTVTDNRRQGCSLTSSNTTKSQEGTSTAQSSEKVDEGVKGHSSNVSNGIRAQSSKDHSSSSQGEGVKGESSASDGSNSPKKVKNRKVRKSRRERNAQSPRLQKRMNQQFPDSPPSHALEDPSLAVHPTGACRGLSDDPSRTCALCSMKAEVTPGKSSSDTPCSASDDSCEAKNEPTQNSEQNTASSKDEKLCKHDPTAPAAKDSPATSSARPQTPTSARAKTPTLSSPKTPVPLTVSVPVRNRDRSATKSAKQPLAPGILDKARGKGMTQHWVTTTELQSPTDAAKTEDKISEKSENTESKNEKSPPAISEYDKTYQTGYNSAMPPNKNPVLELNLQKNNEQPPSTTPSTTGGQQALAAVVSGVMRSAAIQSKKKTKNAKLGMNELLSHSRPLIPTSELNGSAATSHARLSEKLKEGQNGLNADKKEQDSLVALGSLVALTAGLGASQPHPKHPGKQGTRHLSLTTRESELFLNKANDTKAATVQAPMTEYAATKITQAMEETSGASSEEVSPEKDHDAPSSGQASPPPMLLNLDEQGLQEGDDGQQSDDAKDDSIHEGDGESTNPRPHKCAECKVAFRIAGHLAKHLRSKGHIIAMQKKTLNRLKQQQKLSSTTDTMVTGGQGVSTSVSGSTACTDQTQQALYSQLEAGKSGNQEEILNHLVEGAETLAKAQVRALFEGNDEYTEIVTSSGSSELPLDGGASDVRDEGEGFTSLSALSAAGGLDPRPFKCIACKVAFRFQGHLDRHFRSNMHLLAVGHFERDRIGPHPILPPNMVVGDPGMGEEMHGELLDSEMPPDATHNEDENLLVAMETEDEESLAKGLHTHIPEHASSLGDDEANDPFFRDPDSPHIDVEMVDDNNNMELNCRPPDLPDKLSIHNPAHKEAESSGEMSIKAGPAPSISNGPINGLSSVPSDHLKSSFYPIGSEMSKAPPTNNDFKVMKQRMSPAIQSNAKPLFESSPTLTEGPIKSSSPVNRQQQLTC